MLGSHHHSHLSQTGRSDRQKSYDQLQKKFWEKKVKKGEIMSDQGKNENQNKQMFSTEKKFIGQRHKKITVLYLNTVNIHSFTQ